MMRFNHELENGHHRTTKPYQAVFLLLDFSFRLFKGLAVLLSLFNLRRESKLCAIQAGNLTI